jgi:hypothetical protein
MGAIQGLIELVAGLLIIAMLRVLLEPTFDTIKKLCLGMGGFAAEGYTIASNCADAAMWLIVIILALNAVLSAIGLNMSTLITKMKI